MPICTLMYTVWYTRMYTILCTLVYKYNSYLESLCQCVAAVFFDACFSFSQCYGFVFIPRAGFWTSGPVKRQRAHRLVMFGGLLLFLGVFSGCYNRPIGYIFKQKNMEAKDPRTELLNYSQAPGRLDPATWQRLRHVNILTPCYYPTAPSRGGSLKPKRITSSPPLPAVPFLPGHIASKGIPSIHTRSSLESKHCGGVNTTKLTVVPIRKWQLPAFVNPNIQGVLAAKLDQISVLCSDKHVDIACITETWCSESVPDSSICLHGYITLCRDRCDGRQHGGIVWYIRECIPFHHWCHLDERKLDTVWFNTCPQRMPQDFPCITIPTDYIPPTWCKG